MERTTDDCIGSGWCQYYHYSALNMQYISKISNVRAFKLTAGVNHSDRKNRSNNSFPPYTESGDSTTVSRVGFSLLEFFIRCWYSTWSTGRRWSKDGFEPGNTRSLWFFDSAPNPRPNTGISDWCIAISSRPKEIQWVLRERQIISMREPSFKRKGSLQDGRIAWCIDSYSRDDPTSIRLMN